MNRFSYFQGLIARTYPDLAYHDVVVKVDYTVNPPAYELTPLTEYVVASGSIIYIPTLNGDADAQNEALIKNVKQNREKYAVFESVIASGEGTKCIVTIVPSRIWRPDEGSVAGEYVEGELRIEEDDADMFELQHTLNINTT